METIPCARIGSELIAIIRFHVSRSDFETGLFEGEATMAKNDLSGKNGDLVVVSKDGEVREFDDHRKIAFGDIIASSAPGIKYRSAAPVVNTYVYQISILKHVKENE